MTNQGFIIFYSFIIINDFPTFEKIFQNLQIGPKYGLKILLDHWLLHQPKFIGPRVKNITIKALMSLYSEGSHLIDNLFVMGINPSHNKFSPETKFPLKFFHLLFQIYKHENNNQQVKKNESLTAEQR